MLEYRQRALELKAMEREQDFLKVENLALMNALGLKIFSHGTLDIEVKCNNKKIGVDEFRLASLIGRENTDKLKIVPIDAVLKGVEDGSLPPTASTTIITIPGKDFVIIKEVKEERQPRSLSD